MSVKVRLEASRNTDVVTLSFDQLGVSKEDWDKMSKELKEELLQEVIDDMPYAQPYWMVGSFYDKD